MREKWMRTLSGVLAAAFLCGGTGLIVHAAAQTDPAPATQQVLPLTTTQTTTAGASAQTGRLEKEETVYVLADASGQPQKILVSDWIRNGTGAAQITDTGVLTDVENVKGDETYTMDSKGMRVWQANGNDLYCRGVSDEQLPVDVHITYLLDGKEIAPADLAGKSGKVTIRFDYTNNQYETVDVNGQREKIYAPYVMLTGLVLDNECFRNVEISSGKIINDGDRILALGYALPGLKADLGEAAADLDIPESVEITADAENFSLETTMTLAANGLFSQLDPETLTGTGALAAASDGLNALLDGSSSLYGSLSGLLDQMDALASGVDALADGAKQVADGAKTVSGYVSQLNVGLKKLNENSALLTGGASQVFDTLLATANSQLKEAGLSVPTLTRKNYNATLKTVLANWNAAAVQQQVAQKAEETVTAAVRQQTLTIRQGVEAYVRQQTRTGVLASQGLTEEMLNDTTRPLIDAEVNKRMGQSAAVIDQNTEQKIQQTIQEKMQSADMQKTIAATAAQAKASIEALKDQLNAYDTFYQGVLDYTDGVKTAYTGSGDLSKGAQDLAAGAAELQKGVAELQSKLSFVKTDSAQMRTLLNRVQAMVRVARDYRCYTGLAEGMDGTARYVYRTEAIAK